MDKRIIINADDFGLTSGINYGILHAYLQHSISSISLMVNVPRTLEAIDIMKTYHIQCVGIHVNVTLGKPVSDMSAVSSLVDESGEFHKSDWWFCHRANEDELILEFDNQIDLFVKLTGEKPKHINYHHRYDFYKNYPKLSKHLFEKYQLPMRLERDEPGYLYEYAVNQTYFLNHNDNLKKYLNDDLVEFPCHVGFVDKEIMEISSLNMQRMEDSYIVNSQFFKEAYESLGYKLIGFEDIKRKK